MRNNYSIARLHLHGDLDRANTHVGPAKRLLFGLLQRMKLYGVSTGADFRELDDGSVIEARVTGPINTLHVTSGGGGSKTRTIRLKIPIPDFYSGVVVDNGAGFHPTPLTQRRHGNITLDRFSMAQYEEVRPTLFTGTMSKVVQALLGFGKQSHTVQTPDGPKQIASSIYDRLLSKEFDVRDPRQFAFREKHKSYIEYPRYENNSLMLGRLVQYDYRWANTDGITKAADGRLWLVRISKDNGVLAMPLPLHRNSRKPEFREALKAIPYTNAQGDPATYSDEAAIAMIDTFGGFPTGRPMPPDGSLADYIAAGSILQLAPADDLAPYYNYDKISDRTGWAFSEDGSKADNTGRLRVNGRTKAAHYRVSIAINATNEREPTDTMMTLRDLVLADATLNVWDRRLLLSKIYRATDAQLALWVAHSSTAIASIRSATVAPVGSGSATVDEIESGVATTEPRRTYGTRFYPNRGYPVDFDTSGNSAVGAPFDIPILVWYDGNTVRQLRCKYEGPDDPPFAELFASSAMTLPGGGTETISRMEYDPILYIGSADEDLLSREVTRESTYSLDYVSSWPERETYLGALNYDMDQLVGTWYAGRVLLSELQLTIEQRGLEPINCLAIAPEKERSGCYLRTKNRKRSGKRIEVSDMELITDQTRYECTIAPYYPVAMDYRQFTEPSNRYEIVGEHYNGTFDVEVLPQGPHAWMTIGGGSFFEQVGWTDGVIPPWTSKAQVQKNPNTIESQQEIREVSYDVNFHVADHGVIRIASGNGFGDPWAGDSVYDARATRNVFGPSAAIVYSDHPSESPAGDSATGQPAYPDMDAEKSIYVGYVGTNTPPTP